MYLVIFPSAHVPCVLTTEVARAEDAIDAQTAHHRRFLTSVLSEHGVVDPDRRIVAERGCRRSVLHVPAPFGALVNYYLRPTDPVPTTYTWEIRAEFARGEGEHT